MSNVTFAKSLDSFVAVERKGASAFGTLVEFAHSAVQAYMATVEACTTEQQSAALKNSITAEEAAYRVEHPKMAEFPTSYRSAKSVIMSAVKAGVSLVDDKGEYKGKTALENDTKAAKGDSGKTAAEKFAIAMSTATNVFAEVDTLEDIRKCKALMTLLAESIVKAEAAAIAAAASLK